MRELLRRIERLETVSAPVHGKVMFIEWMRPGEVRRAEFGGKVIERDAGESEGEFRARLDECCAPPPHGLALGFLYRDR